MTKIRSSEITPEDVYFSRRDFMKTAGLVAGSAALLAACQPDEAPTEAQSSSAPAAAQPDPVALAQEDELGDPINSYKDITNFNNYYEFTTDKEDVARLSEDFQPRPWAIEVGGLVNNPKTYDIDDLTSKFDQEERVYRLRCVEGWSMVIPWIGFPLSKLLQEVEPTSGAKFVRFETLYDVKRMPGQKVRWYTWPYVEGLRLDEAMNDLTLMATGLYGRDLANSTGAPLRLAVPWKYGFKSIKAIVKIELVDTMPVSLWMNAAPNEYGFYSNVNPDVPHPRWSQGSERRIGEFQRRPTLMFNGYEEQVASLYEGMDLRKNF
jgi:sulfoxide reductase catalytic subunit YedY